MSRKVAHALFCWNFWWKFDAPFFPKPLIHAREAGGTPVSNPTPFKRVRHAGSEAGVPLGGGKLALRHD
jgi:hypothetical protein